MLKLIKKKFKDQRGLTLIELLAVIVILGIIAAIAIPAIGNVIENTRNKATVAEGVQIINAAKLYVSERSTATTPVTTISASDLLPYVDNVKDDDYSVTVSKVSGKTTYTLLNHGAVTLAPGSSTAGSTEEELLAY
ncbi:prepilin-type N-terminal cleavage/methylation domain-containing protein [Bacillus sp. MM2020_1]|nr:prepilin-type N-terminal cleavage/methylation domain-containing protein [Bacillus sp. MM2020_1]